MTKGSVGDHVKAVQCFLNCEPTGEADDELIKAVRAFQRSCALESDGIVGKNTYGALVDTLPTCKRGQAKNNVTRGFQYILGGNLVADGIFGSRTEAAVKAYQSSVGLTADGIIGKNTRKALLLGEVPAEKRQYPAVKPMDYKQYDSRWGKKIYSTHNDPKQTYAASACGPTAMADVCATVVDINITPVTMAELALKWKCRTYDSGTAWNYFRKVYEAFPQFVKFVQTGTLDTARACLAAGGYVVVVFGPSKWTSGGHYCCIWKDDGRLLYINDPASEKESRKTGTYDEVRSAAKQYFCFYPEEVMIT